MIRNNFDNQAYFEYFDIQNFKDDRGRTRWMAWFYKELSDEDMKDLTNGNVKKLQRSRAK